MEIYFKCPKCETRLDVDSEYADKDLVCPQCQTIIRVPRRILGPGITIGGFRIKKLLGKGGMGEVYLASQLSMDRDVALKILPSHLTVQEDLLQRFLNEVRVAARLEHAHIVTAYEAGEDEGVHYLAMAYVKGETLAERLYRDGPMDEATALDMARKIAQALEYAWDEHRILHRDIKPANIMFDAHGEAKLLDMGLSKCLKEADGITLSPTMMGTPNYMSPEQARGDPLDLRADVYALGATLYHALTNQIPFHAKTVIETLQKQATEHLPDPRDYNPDLSEGCMELLALMLAKHQSLRHSDWGSLVSDIDRVRSGARPRKKPLQVGESTILKASELKARQAAKHDRSDVERWMIPLILLILLFSAGLVWMTKRSEKELAPVPESVVVAASEPVNKQPAAHRRAMQQIRRRYKEMMQYAHLHPDDAEQTIEELIELRAEAGHAPFAREIQQGIDVLSKEVVQSRKATLKRLKEEAGRLEEAGEYEAAIAYIEAYNGPHAAQTVKKRAAFVQAVKKRQERAAQVNEIRADELLATLREQVATALLAQEYVEAGQQIQNAFSNPVLNPMHDELIVLNTTVEEIQDMPDIILESFKNDIGKDIILTLKTKKENWEIQAVSQNRIRARRKVGGGYVDRTFTLYDLSFKEKFYRLGKDKTAARDLMRGLLIAELGSYQTAKQYFLRSDTPLGEELAYGIDRHITEVRDDQAQKAYMQLLASADLPEVVQDVAAAAKVIRRTSFVPSRVAEIRRDVTAFNEMYGNTAVAREAAPVLQALAGVDTTPRDIDPQIVEQVLKQLKRDNQDIMDLVSMYDVLDDGLEMNLSGNPGLRDLTALRRLPIRRLNLAQTGVSDLTPLMRMPLQMLKIEGCPVVDLTPLSRLPLQELYANGSKITDVTALRDMELRVLGISGTKVSRISALSDLPIEELNLCGCPIDDLRALRGLPLKVLAICWMPVSDLRPLAHLPLKHLNILGCWAIRDFNVLGRMKELEVIQASSLHYEKLMSPVTAALERKDMETATVEAQKIRKQFNGIAAFVALNQQLKSLVDVTIPQWTELLAEVQVSPQTLRTHAKTFSGKHYVLCPLFLDRDKARVFAQGVKGDLASITSPELQAWIQQHFMVPGLTIWLGGTDAHKEGDWKWLSGKKATYTNWAIGEPTDSGVNGEDALIMMSDGTWGDVAPGQARPFLIEWKK